MAAKPKKPPLTHFLCIPLVTQSSAPQWQASLERFTIDATATSTRPATNAPTQTNSDTHNRANLAPFPNSQSANSTHSHGLHGTSHTTNQRGGSGRSSEAQTAVENARAAGDIPVPRPGPLPTQAIRPLYSLHLTLGVMSLREDGKIAEATRLLKELDVARLLQSAVAGGSDAAQADFSRATNETAVSQMRAKHMSVSFRSLRPMQSARSTSVLYAEADDPTGRLLPLCNALRQAFMDKGFILDEGRDLKLHATIVNTLQARAKWPKKTKKLPAGWGRTEKRGSDVPTQRQNVAPAGAANSTNMRQAVGDEEHDDRGAISADGKLDGRWLMEKWKDHVWADLELERVAICEMGAKADDNGVVRYKEIAEVELVL